MFGLLVELLLVGLIHFVEEVIQLVVQERHGVFVVGVVFGNEVDLHLLESTQVHVLLDLHQYIVELEALQVLLATPLKEHIRDRPQHDVDGYGEEDDEEKYSNKKVHFARGDVLRGLVFGRNLGQLP